MKDKQKKGFWDGYRDTLKSMDTEEHIDLWFYRPIGYCWAKWAAAVGVTPNFITIVSIFLGVGGGILFLFNELWINVIGMLLIVWANSLDSADGQLARMTGQYSRLGRILDGMAGDLWFVTIYVCICLREVVTSDFFMAHHWVIWVLGSVAGASHIMQAAMADYYRQMHLFFLKGKEGSELEDSAEGIDTGAQKGFFGAVKHAMLNSYRSYTRRQERLTPRLQRFRRYLARKYPEQIPQNLRDTFRSGSLPLMKYTNILSFNWRVITLFISIFLKMPWIYFVMEITVGNGIMLYMRGRHEKLCRRLTPAE